VHGRDAMSSSLEVRLSFPRGRCVSVNHVAGRGAERSKVRPWQWAALFSRRRRRRIAAAASPPEGAILAHASESRIPPLFLSLEATQ